MERLIVKSRVGSDGTLSLQLPLGAAQADREVQVTIELPPETMSQEEWQRQVLSTAGKWQGEFQRPEQGPYEQRDAMS
jgi:hypothetical protein